jgi:hypothetical protein
MANRSLDLMGIKHEPNQYIKYKPSIRIASVFGAGYYFCFDMQLS